MKIILSYIIAEDQLPNCQFLAYDSYTHRITHIYRSVPLFITFSNYQLLQNLDYFTASD